MLVLGVHPVEDAAAAGRALLAIAMIGLVGLSVAVVSLAIDDGSGARSATP